MIHFLISINEMFVYHLDIFLFRFILVLFLMCFCSLTKLNKNLVNIIWVEEF